MTLKVEDPPLVLTTLNEEWANKMQNIPEMLNSFVMVSSKKSFFRTPFFFSRGIFNSRFMTMTEMIALA